MGGENLRRLVFKAHRLVYHSDFKAQGPSRTCNESKQEGPGASHAGAAARAASRAAAAGPACGAYLRLIDSCITQYRLLHHAALRLKDLRVARRRRRGAPPGRGSVRVPGV